MPWQLVPLKGGALLSLPDGRSAVVGRGPGCDLSLDDDTISRRHAELRPDAAGIALRDLGSSNGVRVNGVKVTQTRLAESDLVTFGQLAFRVVRTPVEDAAGVREPAPEAELPPGTIVRSIDVSSGGGALARLQAERLARLLELAQKLSGAIELDALLALIVAQAAALLPVDRVALLLEQEGELRLAHWHNRLGAAPVAVPRSIARQAFRDRTPVSSENALADPRFQSGSVVQGQVRAALCVPLLADQERVLGVLYVDSLTAAQPFSESDAALCFAFGGLAAVSIAKAHFAEAARREAVSRANFERFFAPGVAAQIAAHQSGARPGGERRAVTVLYSDVRGFTRLAETLPPEAVAAQLSEYFAAMVELVFAHGGTLDKFIGDALLAVWGAPLPATDAADQALAAARAMQGAMGGLNAHWCTVGQPALGVGIGLHHGDAFTGTIGSPRRLEYTVIGDVVNVAARLCAAAEAGEIVLSESVRENLDQASALSAAEPLALRGREAAVTAYRIGAQNG
ncbi:MAG TPA: adenylate/guanylate cyclase domain-containing protein [Gemmatimonadales bacterium]